MAADGQSAGKALRNIRRQLWQQVPLREFVWPSDLGPATCTAGQEWLLSEGLAAPAGHTISRSYQRAFLKKLMMLCEQCLVEPADTVYEYYVSLLNDLDAMRMGSAMEGPPLGDQPGLSTFSFKTYDLGADTGLLTLRESTAIISEGTTGLRAWEAAAALSEWVLANREQLAGQTVLELGAGVGLVGLTAWRSAAARVILTDVHASVLDNLNANVQLNTERNRTCQAAVAQHGGIEVHQLDWLAPDTAYLQALDPSVVLGADLVYDVDLIPALVSLLKSVLLPAATRWKPRYALMASTQRNSATLAAFLTVLQKEGICTETMTLTPSRIFHRPQAAIIFLHRLTITNDGRS